MARRRHFEDFSTKPARVWTVEVVDAGVHTTEGPRGGTSTSDSASFPNGEDATRQAEAWVQARLASGFQEVHPYIGVTRGERSVKRSDTAQWSEGYAEAYLRVHQDDRRLVTDRGYAFRGGQESVERRERWFHSIEEASGIYDDQLTSARATTPTPRSPRTCETVPLDASVVSACQASGDRSAFVVLADDLIARGDPRGEIAALSLAGHAAQARGLLEACFASLWRHGIDLRFSLANGFVVGVVVSVTTSGELLAAAIRDVMSSPLCTFAEALTIDASDRNAGHHDIAWESVVDAVVATCEPRLRSLDVCDYHHNSQANHDLAALAPVLDGGLSRLHHLGLLGNSWEADHIATLAAASHLPKLRSLDVSNGSWSPSAITALVRHAKKFQDLTSFKLLRGEVETPFRRTAARLERVLPSATIELWNDC